MKISKLTRKCKVLNEDRYIIGKNYYIVIDGATPLIKKEGINLANYMVAYIKKNIDKYEGRIVNRLTNLAKDIAKDLNLDSDDPAYLPSASISVVEEIDNFFYASVLGDCEVVFKTKFNELIRIHSNELSVFDNEALNQMIHISKEQNIDIIDARPLIQETLINNRRMINKENGYNAFTIGDNIDLKPIEFSMEKEKVSQIYLYTDGFASIFTQFHLYNSYKDLFKNNVDIKLEVNKIVENANLDNKCNKYPRFKKIDDITIIKLENE